MDKAQTVSLLNKIYENAKTGKDAIDIMIEKSVSSDMREVLFNQQTKYHNIAMEASALLGGLRELPPERSIIRRLDIFGEMSMLYSGKSQRLAESIINGSTGGIMEIKALINKNPDADNFSKHLAERLIALERESIELAEKYL